MGHRIAAPWMIELKLGCICTLVGCCTWSVTCWLPMISQHEDVASCIITHRIVMSWMVGVDAEGLCTLVQMLYIHLQGKMCKPKS